MVCSRHSSLFSIMLLKILPISPCFPIPKRFLYFDVSVTVAFHFQILKSILIFQTAVQQATTNFTTWNNTHLLAQSTISQRFSKAWLGLWSWHHKAKIKMLTKLSPHLEALKKNLLPSSFFFFSGNIRSIIVIGLDQPKKTLGF